MFLQKFARHGGWCATTTYFCMFCSCMSRFRQEGQPGGCETSGTEQCYHTTSTLLRPHLVLRPYHNLALVHYVKLVPAHYCIIAWIKHDYRKGRRINIKYQFLPIEILPDTLAKTNNKRICLPIEILPVAQKKSWWLLCLLCPASSPNHPPSSLCF